MHEQNAQLQQQLSERDQTNNQLAEIVQKLEMRQRKALTLNRIN